MNGVPAVRHLDLQLPAKNLLLRSTALFSDVVQAERQVLLVRWLGIAVTIAALPFLHLGMRMWDVVVGAAIYNLAFQIHIIPHRPDLLARGFLTTAGDALLGGAAVFATGGLHSEFYVVYFLVAVVAAIRFGGTMALVSTAVALASYMGIVLGLGAPLNTGTLATVLLRIGFVGITGLFVGFVGDRARAAEAALQNELDRAQKMLTEASVAIAADLDLQRALSITAEWTLTLTGGCAAWVRLLVTEEVREWVAANALADEAKAVRPGAEARLTDLGRLISGEVSQAGATNTELVVPMVYGPQAIGAIAVALPAGVRMDGTVRALLESFAVRAAAALVNARSYALVRRQASTDPTTGIANHRRFKQRLIELETNAHDGQIGPTSLIMIDLDFFKEFNDLQGHQAGDRILHCVAQILSESAGAGGMAARYGGDEFVILLPDTDREGAVLCAEQVLLNFAEAVRERRGGLAEPVGLSAGVATIQTSDEDYQVLIGRADLAMYMAKRAGGGRIQCFEDDGKADEPLQALMSNIAAHMHRTERRTRRAPALPGGRAAERALAKGHGPVRPNEAVRALVAAIAAKDATLHVHCRNVARLSIGLARMLGLSEREVADIGIAGLLHDVGKIGVPDAILQKPGRLDASELDIIHRHAIQGAEILDMVPGLVGVAVGVKHHHEEYDGKGYPGGLAGDAIPIAARIVSAADAFDAIIADRPYRAGRPPREALAMMLDGGGRQFDPRVVAALVGLVSKRLPVLERSALRLTHRPDGAA